MYHSDGSEKDDTDDRVPETSKADNAKSRNVHENANNEQPLEMADAECMGKDKIEVVHTTDLDDGIDDGYIPIEEDMKKAIVDKDENNLLCRTETNLDSNEYQYAYSMPLQLKKDSDPRYSYLENKKDEHANVDEHAYTGLQSRGHESHDPLAPQTSNLYIEIQDL